MIHNDSSFKSETCAVPSIHSGSTQEVRSSNLCYVAFVSAFTNLPLQAHWAVSPPAAFSISRSVSSGSALPDTNGSSSAPEASTAAEYCELCNIPQTTPAWWGCQHGVFWSPSPAAWLWLADSGAGRLAVAGSFWRRAPAVAVAGALWCRCGAYG